ncbi:hypothetical protein Psi02_76040 [Planotetraspora silvatica]|uniref:Uncharacterized protein n=1 Tax=Planotetraspora silvatica TaxID=234614 RepID=A0A8J3V724_9ACTN|nr:hypothetical protein [Planotetraspora silvatica]GII51180.1 hypothetical protein Psi02_76040 [Planotetraspora silvatica]
MDWALISGFAGAVLGAGTSLTGTLLTLRHQARQEHNKRVEDQERTALTRARDAIVTLMRLEDKPSADLQIRYLRDKVTTRDYAAGVANLKEADASWTQQRDDALLVLQMAIDDFSNDALWQAMEDVHLLLWNADFLLNHLRAAESITRRMACHHARECLAAFSRGKPLPKGSPRYLQAVQTVKNWFAEQEYIKEILDDERRRKAREAEAKLDRELFSSSDTGFVPDIDPTDESSTLKPNSGDTSPGAV